MEKYTIEDIIFLSQLSHILPVKKIQEVQIQKEEKDNITCLKLVSSDNEVILESNYNSYNNSLSGIYKNWVVEKESEFSIKKVSANTLLLMQNIDKSTLDMKFIFSEKSKGLGVVEFIKNDFEVLGLSSIADMQFLTIDEEKQGKTLVKQFEKNKNKNS